MQNTYMHEVIEDIQRPILKMVTYVGKNKIKYQIIMLKPIIIYKILDSFS